ncbi:hypothetical protein VPH35_140509 [Triticum aestivum]
MTRSSRRPCGRHLDGMGLQDKIQENSTKDKEPIAAIAPLSCCGSDAEGSAVGNFEGLKHPERKRKTGRPTTSRDKPPYHDRGAKSKKYKRAPNAEDANRCGTSKRTRFCSIHAGNQGTRAAHAPSEEIFLRRKGKRRNAQTVVLVGTGETHATSQKLFCIWSRK